MNEDEAMIENRSADHAAAAAGPMRVDQTATVNDALQPDEAGQHQTEAAASAEPVETQTTLEVGLIRTVRYGPIMVGSAILFAALAFAISFFFPVEEGADYTVGQVAGFMAVIGAIVGLTLGAVLALILGIFAKRRTGSAIAVLTDVR